MITASQIRKIHTLKHIIGLDDDSYFELLFSFDVQSSKNLTYTDKTYYDMQTVLVSLNMDFKSANAYNRTMPDYFLKLYFTSPAYELMKHIYTLIQQVGMKF